MFMISIRNDTNVHNIGMKSLFIISRRAEAYGEINLRVEQIPIFTNKTCITV